MDYDALKNKTTREIKKMLGSLDEATNETTRGVNPLVSVCMTLCDRIVSLEDQIQPFKKDEIQAAIIENTQPNTGGKTIDLKEQVREAAMAAEKQNPDEFNAMSWLDLELENNPGLFDCCFDRGWDELSGNEQGKRAAEIRSFL